MGQNIDPAPIVCLSSSTKPHVFGLFGRHRKPHCVYCGETKRDDNQEDYCYERD